MQWPKGSGGMANIILSLSCHPRWDDYVKSKLVGSNTSEYYRPGEGEDFMALQVCWLDDLAKAQETARNTNKPILLDFYNPQ